MRAELAEQFSRELGEELEALGYDLPQSGPRQGGRRRRSSWLRTPDAIPPSLEEDKLIKTTPRPPDAGAGSSGKTRHDAAKEAQLLQDQGERLRDQAERLRQQENVLRAMLGSRAFAVAEQLSRLHQRGRPVFSRQQVRRALGEEDGRV
jgi:hypothetical protein